MSQGNGKMFFPCIMEIHRGLSKYMKMIIQNITSKIAIKYAKPYSIVVHQILMKQQVRMVINCLAL